MVFFEKISKFLREVRSETKKINWPTKKETINYTLIVIFTFLITALILVVLTGFLINF